MAKDMAVLPTVKIKVFFRETRKIGEKSILVKFLRPANCRLLDPAALD
jgi:hypothetical protein